MKQQQKHLNHSHLVMEESNTASKAATLSATILFPPVPLPLLVPVPAPVAVIVGTPLLARRREKSFLKPQEPRRTNKERPNHRSNFFRFSVTCCTASGLWGRATMFPSGPCTYTGGRYTPSVSARLPQKLTTAPKVNIKALAFMPSSWSQCIVSYHS
jgi:hypothetical protein